MFLIAIYLVFVIRLEHACDVVSLYLQQVLLVAYQVFIECFSVAEGIILGCPRVRCFAHQHDMKCS